jgi:hypothetical protein
MKHGDMMVMTGTEIQKVYEVSNLHQKSLGMSDILSTLLTPTECAASRSPLDTSTPSGWSHRRTGTTPPSRARSPLTPKPSSMTASESATTRHRRCGGSLERRQLCICHRCFHILHFPEMTLIFAIFSVISFVQTNSYTRKAGLLLPVLCGLWYQDPKSGQGFEATCMSCRTGSFHFQGTTTYLAMANWNREGKEKGSGASRSTVCRHGLAQGFLYGAQLGGCTLLVFSFIHISSRLDKHKHLLLVEG